MIFAADSVGVAHGYWLSRLQREIARISPQVDQKNALSVSDIGSSDPRP